MGQVRKVSGVATSIRTENGDTIVRYHNTDVVRFNGKYVVLNSGGWRTRTTLTRMNQAANQFGLGYKVYQRKGVWMIRQYIENGPDTVYVDLMQFRRATPVCK